jgi:hypothetical protein
VFRWAGRLVTICALCCAIGLQWFALQSVAWTTMLIQNSKGATLTQAIARTFDGAHPCSLCHVVEKGKNAEKKAGAIAPVVKIDMILAAHTAPVPRTFVPVTYFSDIFALTINDDSPPVPPPRSRLG